VFPLSISDDAGADAFVLMATSIYLLSVIFSLSLSLSLKRENTPSGVVKLENVCISFVAENREREREKSLCGSNDRHLRITAATHLHTHTHGLGQ